MLKFGFKQRGKGLVSKTCLTIGNDAGTTYGFIKGTYGSISPVNNKQGAEYSVFTWDASTGHFIVEFVQGQMVGVEGITLTDYNGTLSLTLHWNDLLGYYETIDTTLATNLPTNGIICFVGQTHAYPATTVYYKGTPVTYKGMVITNG